MKNASMIFTTMFLLMTATVTDTSAAEAANSSPMSLSSRPTVLIAGSGGEWQAAGRKPEEIATVGAKMVQECSSHELCQKKKALCIKTCAHAHGAHGDIQGYKCTMKCKKCVPDC